MLSWGVQHLEKCQHCYQKTGKVLVSGRDPVGERDRQEKGAKLVWHSASNEWQALKTCEPSLDSEPNPNRGISAHQLSSAKEFYTFNALSSRLIRSARHCRGTVPTCNMPSLLLGRRRGHTWHWSSPGRVVGRENWIFRLQSRPPATSRERILITQDVEGKREGWLTGPEKTAFPPPNQPQYDTSRERWCTCRWNPFID